MAVTHYLTDMHQNPANTTYGADHNAAYDYTVTSRGAKENVASSHLG